MSVVLAVEVATMMIAIPMVVMLATAAIGLPVSLEEALSVVMRSYPMGASIRRTRPVARMPFVMVPDWIPISLYPHEVGIRTRRHGVSHARGWRWPDSDAYGNIGCED
jgi:hypothetical protein